jgi:DNA-binding response OmpR family regulator
VILPDPNQRRFIRYLERVVILDPNPHTARMLMDLLKELGAKSMYAETTARKAFSLCKSEDPQIIFTELSAGGVDGLAFTKALRRSDLACRKAPVIMVTSEATAAAILGARDAGVHEFLRKPFNMKDLVRRIEAVTLKPREWVEAMQYIGPDRRRFNSAEYRGPRKRKADSAEMTAAARIEQAVRIVKAALPAISTDPAQAMRALSAQASELIKAGVSSGNTKLATQAAALQTVLNEAQAAGGLDINRLEPVCQPLWAYLPSDSQAA